MPRAKTRAAMNRPASAGNRNAVGNVSKRKGSVREQQARLRADRKLNLAVEECVDALLEIIRARRQDVADQLGVTRSTNIDVQHAVDTILDRKIPRKTQADIALEGMPSVTIKIPGLGWPAMSGDPVVTVKEATPRQAVLDALEAARA